MTETEKKPEKKLETKPSRTLSVLEESERDIEKMVATLEWLAAHPNEPLKRP